MPMNSTKKISNVATKEIPQWQKNYIHTKIFAHRVYLENLPKPNVKELEIIPNNP